MSKLVITLLSACCFAAIAPGSAVADDLSDARKAYEQAKKEYAAELTRAITQAKRDGNDEQAQELASEQASLKVGFNVSSLVGAWRFDYNNGATRTYVFAPNGQVKFAEKNAIGRITPSQGGLVVRFSGMPAAEVITVKPTVTLLHYNPAKTLGNAKPKHTAIGKKLD